MESSFNLCWTWSDRLFASKKQHFTAFFEKNLREATGFTKTFDAQWEQYDYQGVLTLYDQHLNRRDLFILAFGAVYIIQIVDAAVEAHFVQFDVSEDLSLNLHPTMLSLTNPGLKLTLNFR